VVRTVRAVLYTEVDFTEAIDREDANECGGSITRVARRERLLKQWKEIVTMETKKESRETEDEKEIESKCEGVNAMERGYELCL